MSMYVMGTLPEFLSKDVQTNSSDSGPAVSKLLLTLFGDASLVIDICSMEFEALWYDGFQKILFRLRTQPSEAEL